jgi:hypothetical protein
MIAPKKIDGSYVLPAVTSSRAASAVLCSERASLVHSILWSKSRKPISYLPEWDAPPRRGIDCGQLASVAASKAKPCDRCSRPPIYVPEKDIK